jgi:RNA polymerase sigma factor (sigma-70 family)
MIEDAELLRRYAEDKSEQAFAELVQRHLGLVYGCALRRVGGDRHLAEEVAQQVFADVARHAMVLAWRPVLAGWLFTSARFAAAKAMRAARRRVAREQEAYLMHELSHDDTAPVDWERTRPVLDDAIAELNERDREAILLRFFEARDFSTIGAKLNLSDNAARMRVERALEKLRACLERHGVTSTAAAVATVLSQQAGVAMPAGLAANVTTAALAGAAMATGVGVAGSTSATVAFMSVTKLQIGIAGALILAGGTGFVIQAQNNDVLRRQMADLQQQNQEMNSLRTENHRLKAKVSEVAALRQDDVALSRLRDEAAALRDRMKDRAIITTERAAFATNVPVRKVSEKTAAVLRNLKPLQDAKNWSEMIDLVDGVMSQVEPTSYDMAYLLDLKAKIFLQQDQYSKAIEPWEKALQLSRQYSYFDEKQMFDIAGFVDQLRYSERSKSEGLPAPSAPWF